MLAWLITFLVFGAVTLLALTVLRPSGISVQSRLSNYGDRPKVGRVAGRSFSARILLPMVDSLAKVARSMSTESFEKDMRERLARAGSPGGLDVNAFLALRGAGLVVLPLLVGGPRLLAGKVDLMTIGLMLGLALVGWRLPTFWLDQRAEARQKKITRALPDALDLMIVCVEAGNSLEAALSIVAERLRGPLAEEFARTLREMALGKTRQEAMRDLAERVNSPDLRTFIAALIQADQLGVGVAQVFRVQGDAMRVRRRQRAEEQAAKIPVLMLIPLVIFILPSLMIVILGPVAMRFASFLGSGAIK